MRKEVLNLEESEEGHMLVKKEKRDGGKVLRS